MTWFTYHLPRSDHFKQQQHPPQKEQQIKSNCLTQLLSSISLNSNSMIFYFICFILLSLCCFANSHESNYYYYYNSDGDAIQVKNTQSDEENTKHDSLLPKDFFSVFSNEIPIINSIENQSLNENNREQIDYYKQTAPNQIPIVKFSLPELDFGEQFIGVPKMQTINLINIGLDYLRLESISGSTVHFYCSFFTEKLIPSGGNTSFDVYYLARELGPVESALFINTNKGIIKYKVKGVGIRNPFKLKPILNARIPINTSFTSQIVLHNPLNVSLQINEMFTSDDDLHIELTNQIKSKQIKINDLKLSKDIWNLNPYETRQIALVHYIGRQANNHTAFICIKTNLNHTFVIPFELEVTKQPGLFSPLTLIDFGDMSFYESSNESKEYFNSIGTVLYENEKKLITNEKSIDLYLMNSAKTPIRITEIFSVRNNPALKINYFNNIVLPPNTSHLTKVARIQFDPKKSKKSSQNYGKIMVKTNNTNITFQIGFNADLYKGSIEYEKTNFIYYLSQNETKRETEQVNSIDLLNGYSFPIVIYDIHLNDHAQNYFEIDFKGPQLMKPNKLKQVFRVKFFLQKYLKDLKSNSTKSNNKKHQFNNQNHFYTICSINTNFSSFKIPIHVYDGQLVLKFLNEDNELINDLNLGGLSINSIKEYKLQIENYNPIDITLNNLEIRSLLNQVDKEDNNFKIKFELKFLYYEQLIGNVNDLVFSEFRVQLNQTYLNDQIKNNLKVTAYNRMVIGLTLRPSYSNLKFIASDLFKYELAIATEYESKNVKFELRIVNGALDLVSSSNQKLKYVDISNFPTQISKCPIYIKSSFNTNLEIQSIEFLNYGNLFTFKWSPLNEQTNKKFGLIQPKITNLIGNLYFDSRMLCEPNCYIGLNENVSPHLYDIWLKSLNLKQLKLPDNTHLMETFDFDYSLVHLLKIRFNDLMQSKEYFTSSIRFQLSHDSLNDKSDLFSYSFPIKFDFRLPRLTNLNSVIDFPLSQVHTTTSYYNLTLHNPSSSSVLMQIMFLNNYPQKQKLLNLIQSEFDLDYSLDNLAKMNPDEPVFSLHVPLSYQQFNIEHQQILEKLEYNFKIVPNKNSFVLLVPANETRNLQIKYNPNKLGHFEDMVIIRNNLTVIDAFMLRADAGTAELSINNMAPMRNSLFFDGIQSDVLTDPQSTSDLSNLVIEMTKEDFANCDFKVPELTEYDLKLDLMNYKSYLEKLSVNEVNLHEKKAYRTSYRSKDGILLRNFLVLKNVGNTELYVYAVLFDGEPCYSRGIELTDCNSFSIQPYPNNTYLLELRYRPDFTMSLIRKSLTITTNIGDLEYLIEVKIPHYMLSACHDSLPRPEFEEYFYYIGTFLIIIFIFIMLATSMLDSNTLIRRKPKIHPIVISNEIKHLLNNQSTQVLDDKKQDIAQMIANNKQRNKSNETINTTTTTINVTKTPPASPRVVKNHDTNQRTVPKTIKLVETTKKITNPSISKKLKDKDTDSDSASVTSSKSMSTVPTITPASKPLIVKQNSTPLSNETTKATPIDSSPDTSTKPVQNQLTRTVSLTPKNSPPMIQKVTNNKKVEDETSNQQKKVKNFSSTNESLASTRRNYLTQQNLNKNNNSNPQQSNEKISTNKKQLTNNSNKNRIQPPIMTTISNKQVNCERTDLETLNNQFKQIQQQKQQLKESSIGIISKQQQNYLNVNPIYNPKTPPTLSSSSSSSTRTQNDLFNILLNSNEEKSGEFSRSMSILSKRSTSSLSGLVAQSESVSRPDSPIIDYTNQSIYFDQQNKAHFLSKLNKLSSDFQQPTEESTSLGEIIDDYTIISELSSFNIDDKLINSRNSPLSLSSASVTSDLWIIPNQDGETFNNPQSPDDDYDFLVQETEKFNKNFENYNFNNNTIKNEKTKFNKTSNKRSLNSESPNSNEANKESQNKLTSNRKNQNNLKASISAPVPDSLNYFDSKSLKSNIIHSNSVPITSNTINNNKHFGPIQRPNGYQSSNSNNINNNITNNLFLTLPSNSLPSTTVNSTGALDQVFQLTGDDLKMLSMLLTMQELNNRNNNDDQCFNFMKLNPAINNNNNNVTCNNTNKKNDLNSFEFSLFGTDLDKEKKIMLNNPFGSGLVPEEETSYWPPIDTTLNTTSPATVSTNSTKTTTASNQPWNSVLLNDFDEPSSLTGTSSSAIRNLWSKDTSNDSENMKTD